MRTTRLQAWTAVLLGLVVGCAQAAEPRHAVCCANGWNLTHEQALFTRAPTSVRAGRNPATAPMISVDQLYRVTLVPQQDVTFAATPGRKRQIAGAYAGIARFEVPSGGTYRIAIDQKFWIDILHGGNVLASTRFTDEKGCAPHKIVAYTLPQGTLVLQLSGHASPQVNISITRAPPATTPH